MHDIEVKAGKTFRYDLWFSGEPEPDVTWERNGVGLAADDSGRITIENFLKKGENHNQLCEQLMRGLTAGTYCEKNSVLMVVRADRKEDSGMFKIRLTCMGGSAEATGRVNVLDVPTKPRNFQADEASCKNILEISRTLTVNDEILTVGYLFVTSSQTGLSRPVSSIFGEKSQAEIILSLLRSGLDIVVSPGTLRRMTEALRYSNI